MSTGSARASTRSTGGCTPTRRRTRSECVNLRVRAAVEAAGARLPEWPATGTGQPFAEHEAYFPETGPTALPVYRRADLPPEHPVKGPALIEDPWATTLVYPGHTAASTRREPVDGVDRTSARRVPDPRARLERGNVRQSELTPSLEVVRHAIYAIAEEMSLIIMRSARSRSSRRRATSRARSPTPAAG